MDRINPFPYKGIEIEAKDLTFFCVMRGNTIKIS